VASSWSPSHKALEHKGSLYARAGLSGWRYTRSEMFDASARIPVSQLLP